MEVYTMCNCLQSLLHVITDVLLIQVLCACKEGAPVSGAQKSFRQAKVSL